MNLKELKTRNEFLNLQSIKLTEKLNDYIVNNSKKITTILDQDLPLNCSLDISSYIYYRYKYYSICSENLLKSIFNNLIQSKIKIDLNHVEDLITIKYICNKLKNKESYKDNSVVAEFNLNNGFLKILNKNVIVKSIEIEFYPKKFIHLEKLFDKNIKININLKDLSLYISSIKSKYIIDQLKLIKDQSIDDIKYLSSHNYYENYSYNEILPEKFESDYFIDFLKKIDKDKQIFILNFLFNIAPGIISNFDIQQYKKDKNFYIIEWVINKF